MRAVGGQFCVHSITGQGTEVAVAVPAMEGG
jgi:signal transduction histidine kinase